MRGGGKGGRGRKHASNLARLETASELKQLLTLNSNRRLYKHQTKNNEHAVQIMSISMTKKDISGFDPVVDFT